MLQLGTNINWEASGNEETLRNATKLCETLLKTPRASRNLRVAITRSRDIPSSPCCGATFCASGTSGADEAS